MAGVETMSQQQQEQEQVEGEKEEVKVVDAKRTESDGATLEYLSYRDGVGAKTEGSVSKSMNSIVWCLPDPSGSSSGEIKDVSGGGTCG